ncbi:M28 family metallopeptidase [Caulobacter sp. S45]|uniref:M28 family metallopeptidase n=1 Tax=Caulobacter sp. S45 TaxID=1641861 RepID=UPI001C2098B6|nr:M28 family metallopeptidase [Caulobacter sp. S45]
MRRSVGLGLAATVAFGSAALAASGPIDPGQMSATVKVLASDAFGGRAPGTPGEARTVDYLIKRFKAMGLQPGGENGGWTQAVPLVRTQVGAPSTLSFHDAKGAVALRQGEEISIATVRPVDRVRIKDAPLVFVGYGVHAPERGWDDFKGVDLHGKIAVFLVNDPDFEAQPGEPVAGKFGGKAMTYYGRWTYKYEEAARRGAVGALIVHDAPGAGYGWSTVVAPGGEAYDIVRPAGAVQPVLLQGWLRGDAAQDLFRRTGLDLAALRVKARRADFHPVALGGLRFDADVPVTATHVQSHNVLAKLVGTAHPDETVMFAAHWDAFGIGKPDATGDRIRRGANDDGLGIAGVLEIARAFTHAPKPQRTLVFAAWTAEERGLLGSETYATRPIYPLAKTAGNLTMDILETAGPSHDVVLIGAGQDSLEGDLARVAAGQGRKVTPDSHPEKGLFYRADHFSVAKRGVPTVLLMAIGGGPDLVAGGRAAGDKWVNDYTAKCYHQPCDAWSAAWDLRGAAQDVELLYDTGSMLANSRRWPTWNAGSEFKALRDQTAAERK